MAKYRQDLIQDAMHEMRRNRNLTAKQAVKIALQNAGYKVQPETVKDVSKALKTIMRHK